MNLNPNSNGPSARQMMERIKQLEEELARKNHELVSERSDAQARLTVVESKLLAFENFEQMRHSNQKTLVNKPEVFTGGSNQSLDAFIGLMDLYVSTVPENMKLNVAVSFLSGHAYDWFKVIENVDNIDSWNKLKDMMKSRFEPINKVKSARDKLGRWRQDRDVSHYNESFLQIIINIPNISKDEVIDRYMRGLKPDISQELCTNEYCSITKAMSDALSVEAAKTSFRKWSPRPGNSYRAGWPRPGPPNFGNVQDLVRTEEIDSDCQCRRRLTDQLLWICPTQICNFPSETPNGIEIGTVERALNATDKVAGGKLALTDPTIPAQDFLRLVYLMLKLTLMQNREKTAPSKFNH